MREPSIKKSNPMSALKLPPDWQASSAAPAEFIPIIDTREQAPYIIPGSITATLKTGDYSILGLETEIAIERKSLPDLLGSITTGRERFEREFARMSDYRFRAMVIEAGLAHILSGQYISQVAVESVIGTLAAWSFRYGVHIFFAGCRGAAQQLTWALLKKYHEIRSQCRSIEIETSDGMEIDIVHPGEVDLYIDNIPEIPINANPPPARYSATIVTDGLAHFGATPQVAAALEAMAESSIKTGRYFFFAGNYAGARPLQDKFIKKYYDDLSKIDKLDPEILAKMKKRVIFY